VAIHGANLEALTGDDTFRIPLARCTLHYEGRRVLVRDQQGALAIWSDDAGFLPALERAQRGMLSREVQRLRAVARRKRLMKWCVTTAITVVATCAAAIPVTRWAVAGSVPSIADRVGESAVERLALPTGVAPQVEQALFAIAEQLRPAVAPSARSFRLLLADYSDVHSFDLPPATVVVTAGLVCAAREPDAVTTTVARELAHLESRDVSRRVAEAVDWRSTYDLARGDVTTLRTRMLDFADPSRNPGFDPAQRTAADRRADAILTAAAVPRDSADKGGQGAGVRSLDWSKVRAEACGLIGR
jgi:hypothetical protein